MAEPWILKALGVKARERKPVMQSHVEREARRCAIPGGQTERTKRGWKLVGLNQDKREGKAQGAKYGEQSPCGQRPLERSSEGKGLGEKRPAGANPKIDDPGVKDP
jgi:hypothetical protein